MLGHGATGQFAIGEVGAAAGAESITPDKWYAALSEPVRFKRGVSASQQQFAAFPNPFPFVSFGWYAELSKPPLLTRPRLNPSELPFFFFQPAPSPFVATGWYEPLSEPVRFKRGLRPQQTPFFAYQDNPTTVTPFAWFAGLSEPVRKRPGLKAGQQQFFASDPTVIPVTTFLNGWFTALGEPVRYKVGLKPPLQQFYAAPTRLLPTPNLLGVLAALETKDTMLAGAMVWNRATDAEIGVINTTPQPAEIGLSAAAPTAGVITVRISIVIG